MSHCDSLVCLVVWAGYLWCKCWVFVVCCQDCASGGYTPSSQEVKFYGVYIIHVCRNFRCGVQCGVPVVLWVRHI